ncbi:MAG TPA: NAD(P)/FAD-dependent oxidoreductase [Syntrophomonas sp.]|nr:NAD(P)/FAD-dependent oxidoreductase [Syntrophomonas sp.]
MEKVKSYIKEEVEKMANFDVILVGAGLGGCSSAALLAKRGLKVLLLEKGATAGGKAASISRNGFNFCQWQVSGCPTINNKYDVVLEELGKKEAVRFYTAKEATMVHVKPNGETASVVLDMANGIDMGVVLNWLGIEGKGQENTERVFNDIVTMSEQDIDALDDVTFKEFLDRYDLPKAAYAFLTSCFVDPMLLCTAETMCASEAVMVLKECLLYGYAIEFEGGMGKLAQLWVDSIEENGGTVMMDTRVNKIVVEDGKIVGVATDKGFFKAPIVISNAGIQPTVLKLVGEEHFDKAYVNYVKDLVMSQAWMGGRYYLSQKVTNSNFVMYFSDDDTLRPDHMFAARKKDGSPNVSAMYALSPSNYDPTCAPEGKQLILTGYACPKDPNDMTPDDIEKYVAIQEKKLFDALPDLPKYLEKREIFTTRTVQKTSRDYDIPGQGGELIGLAQIVGQCGKSKPSPKAPIRGLFYVGTDAGGRTIGTNQAVDSGINVARMAQHYHLMHGGR